MRFYSYACSSCRHEFEALVDSADEQIVCPMCNSPHAVRDEICRVAIRPSNRRWGGVRDLSSNSCPCGCAKRKTA